MITFMYSLGKNMTSLTPDINLSVDWNCLSTPRFGLNDTAERLSVVAPVELYPQCRGQIKRSVSVWLIHRYTFKCKTLILLLCVMMNLPGC